MTLRDAVYERLFSLGKPFAVVGNCHGAFDSRKRHALFAKNGVELLVPNRRVAYIRDYKNQGIKTCPPFQSWYFCHKVLPRAIVFVDMEEAGNDG